MQITIATTWSEPAPVAAGGIADRSLVEDVAIAPIDVSADFTGEGITYALAPSSAALPAGLSLSSAGIISGTPTTAAAQVNIVVRGSNSGGFADTAFGITIIVTGSEISVAVGGLDAAIDAAIAADDGRTLSLAPGEHFDFTERGLFNLKGFNTNPILIKSSDPENPAIFPGMTLDEDRANLVFEDISFVFTFDAQQVGADSRFSKPQSLGNGSNITFTRCSFVGSNHDGTGDSTLEGSAAGFGLLISGGSNLLIQDCTFTQFFKAISIGQNSEDIDILRNTFTLMSGDAINLTSGSRRVVFRDNYVGVKQVDGSLNHPDQFQIFQVIDATRNMVGNVIEDNVFDIGDGPDTQIIFLGNQKFENSGLDADRQEDLIIRRNLIRTLSGHGISAGAGNGSIIDNNTVLFHGTSTGAVGASLPNITANNGINITMTDNVAPNIDLSDDDGSWAASNNLELQWDGPEKPGSYAFDQFLTSTMDPADVRNFRYDPAGQIAQGTMGYRGLLLDTTPASPLAIFDVHQSAADDSFTFAFTDHTYGPSGKIGTGTATWAWNFGDGNTSTAQNPTHTYAASGTYTVTMTVTEGGTDYVATFDLPVRGNQIAIWDGATGVIEQTILGTTSTLTGSGNGAVSDGATGFWIDTGNGLVADQSYIQWEDLASFYDTNTFDLNMTFATDTSTPGQTGHIVENFQTILIDLRSGRIVCDIATPEGGTVTLQSTATDYDDAVDHDIRLHFVGGTVTLYVDSVSEDSAALSAVSSANGRDMLFGGRNAEGGVSAKVKAFSLEIDGSDFSVA